MKPTSARGKQVFVELSPSRLEVAVANGATVTSRVAAHSVPEWNAQWPAVLSTLDGPLARMVGDLGGTGCPAMIIYTGPTATVGTFACPQAAGKVGAEKAALLALSGTCSFSTDENPTRIQVIKSEAAGHIDPPPQVHSLGLADTDESADAVAQLGQRAGLLVQQVIPSEAIGMMGALEAAEAFAAPGEIRAALWLGETSSILAAVNGDRLCFIRTLGVGIDSLVDALMRPIRARQGPGPEGHAPVVLDRTAARQLLESAGVPASEAVVDAERQILGAAILPLLQPVLQRIAIEVKQSMRFGIEEGSKLPVQLTLIGPGALIPNLAEVIARQSGLQLHSRPERVNGPITSCESGNIAVLRRADKAPGLLPRTLDRANVIRLVRRGVWAGLAASLVLMGWDAYSAQRVLGGERARLEQLRRETAPLATPSPMQEQAQAARDKAAAYEERIRDQMGEWVDWSAVLGLLAEQTPDSIRLTGLELTASSGVSACRVTGFVDGVSDPAQVIGRFMNSLGSVPIAKTIELGTTQHVQRAGRDVQQFELTINLVGLPALARSDSRDAGRVAGAAGAP